MIVTRKGCFWTFLYAETIKTHISVKQTLYRMHLDKQINQKHLFYCQLSLNISPLRFWTVISRNNFFCDLEDCFIYFEFTLSGLSGQNHPSKNISSACFLKFKCNLCRVEKLLNLMRRNIINEDVINQWTYLCALCSWKLRINKLAQQYPYERYETHKI